MPLGPVEAGQCRLICRIPQEKQVCGVEPVCLHAAVQAIKIPATLFGMPRKGLVIDLEPLFFHKVLAPLIHRLGVIQGGQWHAFGTGGRCKLFSPDTHDHQLAGDLQVAGVRQRLCRR